MGACQGQTNIKINDDKSKKNSSQVNTLLDNLRHLQKLGLTKNLQGNQSGSGAAGSGNKGASEDITHMDQLKFEKSSFITKGSQKFRDNYIIGQQMGTGKSMIST